MKLNLQNTARGLIPCDDTDYETKCKLKIGQVYSAEIKLVRNYEFLQKYFALINCAYQYLNEDQLIKYPNKTVFRKYLEMTAGYFEPYYSETHKEFRELPISISFESMKEDEFSKLYEAVKDVLFATFLRNISEEEFTKNLINF